MGDSYYMAYANLYNYFLARLGDVTFNSIPQQYRNVLQHPVRGILENVYLHECRVIHSSQRWKGILFEFTFVAQEVTSITQKVPSFINQVNQIFNLIIASINEILTLLTQIQSYGNMISTYFNSTTPNNAVNFTNQTIPQIKNVTLPLLKSSTAILYNNFKPASYTNYYFENHRIDYAKFPSLTPFATGNDDTTINGILDIYNTNVQSIINQINKFGLNIQANNLITALKNSYVNLLDLAKSISINNNQQYISYKLPYTMSIREVCFNNNLDFNDASIIKNILTINPGKFTSVNRIIADTVLLLPKS